VFNWFKKNKNASPLPLRVDMHSHLLPGIDDGVKTIEESVQIISYFRDLGYRKLITTPHVMSDVYRNTPAVINEKLKAVQSALAQNRIDITLEAAAEYYLDETLMASLNADEPLLSFGKKYLLFETSFINEPFFLKEFIFLATAKGYRPVLAHPERYMYLNSDFKKADDLLARGVLFQINISSLTGYYSKAAQEMARSYIDRGWLHWLGTDCHHMAHAQLVKSAASNKYLQKALTLPLLNYTIE
jgi:protein-tyrosine phosphatase